MLLTRSPLEYLRRGLSARLACVKHAASVRPEPGSNSPPKTLMENHHPSNTHHTNRVACLHQRNLTTTLTTKAMARGTNIMHWLLSTLLSSQETNTLSVSHRFRRLPLRGCPLSRLAFVAYPLDLPWSNSAPVNQLGTLIRRTISDSNF